jgi:hypothetical protein
VTPERAQAVLGDPFLLPKTAGEPALYERSGTVSTLLATPAPVLLTETRFTGMMKKLAGSSTKVESTAIEPGVDGLWIEGAPHVFFGPEVPARLAGNVLLWESGAVTFRLEGQTLTKKRALELAREILR